jgi:hypothetical protein
MTCQSKVLKSLWASRYHTATAAAFSTCRREHATQRERESDSLLLHPDNRSTTSEKRITRPQLEELLGLIETPVAYARE